MVRPSAINPTDNKGLNHKDVVVTANTLPADKSVGLLKTYVLASRYGKYILSPHYQQHLL